MSEIVLLDIFVNVGVGGTIGFTIAKLEDMAIIPPFFSFLGR
jgi:hypothetical protein